MHNTNILNSFFLHNAVHDLTIIIKYMRGPSLIQDFISAFPFKRQYFQLIFM